MVRYIEIEVSYSTDVTYLKSVDTEIKNFPINYVFSTRVIMTVIEFRFRDRIKYLVRVVPGFVLVKERDSLNFKLCIFRWTSPNNFDSRKCSRVVFCVLKIKNKVFWIFGRRKEEEGVGPTSWVQLKELYGVTIESVIGGKTNSNTLKWRQQKLNSHKIRWILAHSF